MLSSSRSRIFEEEREEARQVALRLTAALHALHVEGGPIDWEHAGMLAASVPVNDAKVGNLIPVGGSASRDELLEQVRYTLLEAAVCTHLQLRSSANRRSWRFCAACEAGACQKEHLLRQGNAQCGRNGDTRTFWAITSLCIALATNSGPRTQTGRVDLHTSSGCSTMTWRKRRSSR